MMTIDKLVQSVIYDFKGSQPYFLILHRVKNWQGWEFLKGHIQAGERPAETLEREIQEETHLKNFQIGRNLNKRITWVADHKKYIIVDVFLVKAEMNETISLKQEIIEHDDYQWVDKKTALEKLTWDDTKEILRDLKIYPVRNSISNGV